MSQVINVTAGDFEEIVLKSDLPVLVDFWAPWCRPCLMMAPVLDEVSEEMKGKLKVVKLDVDDPRHAELGARYEIRSIPNMKLFKGGQVIKEVVGLRPKEDLIRDISGAL